MDLLNKFRLWASNHPRVLFPAVGVLAAAGLAIGLLQTPGTAGMKAAATTATPATVTRGDLVTAVSGTGKLEPGKSADLSFSAPGHVASLIVQPGDAVTAGQVLASLDEVAALKINASASTLALQTARRSLTDLLNSGPKKLADALTARADAQKALDKAQKNLRKKGDQRCNKPTIEGYYYQYREAWLQVNIWQSYLNDGNTGYGHDFILENLRPLQHTAAEAYANFNYCQGFSDNEIAKSEADLQVAQAALVSAEKSYEVRKANGGLDPAEVAIVQNQVKTAELQSTDAQNNLNGATLTAPFDGTVTAVNGVVGDAVKPATSSQSSAKASSTQVANVAASTTVDTSAFITVVDLANPVVELNIDESDLTGFAVGCQASVVFDTLPNRTFPGEVIEVSPELASVNGVSMAQGTVNLTDVSLAGGKILPQGLTAAVDVNCTLARDALLAPAAAVHTTSDGQTYVNVINTSGVTEKRTVETGARSTDQVEILSGLAEGDRLSTSASGE